jgi:L-fuculose-phosphate aldolase
MLAVLSDEGRVPVARYAAYGTDDLAENAARAPGSAHRACLLCNHGTIAVGSTVDEALSHTELLEQMAELYYRTRVAGEPVILTAEEMDEARQRYTITVSLSRRGPERADDERGHLDRSTRRLLS